MDGSKVLTCNNNLISWKCSVGQWTLTSNLDRGKKCVRENTVLSKRYTVTEGLDDKLGVEFLNNGKLSNQFMTTDQCMTKILINNFFTDYVKTRLFWPTAVSFKPPFPSGHVMAFSGWLTAWLISKKTPSIQECLTMVLKYVCDRKKWRFLRSRSTELRSHEKSKRLTYI